MNPQLSINLGSIQMPLSAVTKTFAILAKRGAGKSYTAAVLAEEFDAAGAPFVVFDPIDVWWGLRLAADGKSPGLPVVVFGMEHADLPLNAGMGAQLAEAVVGRNVSCVLSTFGMPKAQQRRLITDFSATLLRINDRPRHIIIEEAHEFVPQRVMADMAQCFNAVNSLIVMGRNRGLGATLLSQRAATINKDSLTQIDTLLAFRNTAPQDRKALREWVEYHAAEGDFAAFMDSLPSLPTGEGWIWSPEFLEVFERIKIRERRTFHPDRERLGPGFVMPKPSQANLEEFIGIMREVIMPQDDIKPSQKQPLQPKPLAAESASWKEERKALVAEYEAKLKAKEEELAAKAAQVAELQGKIAAIAEIIGIVEAPAPVSNPPSGRLTPKVNKSLVDLWAGKLGGNKSGAGRILYFLADKYPLNFTRAQLALSIGMTASGGSYQSYLSTLIRNSMIVNEDGYLKLSADLILSE